MQLNSYEFILMLLPVTLLFYFTLGRFSISARKLILCVSGIAVYAYAGVKGFIVLLASMVLNFVMTEMMLEREWLKKPMLFATIAMNVGVLLLFKYSNFAIVNLNQLAGTSIKRLNLALPLGISFFTFQQIAYVVSVYKKEIQEVKLLDYAAYVLYFPKLIMGPIVDPVDLISQMNDRERSHWNWENFVSGIKLFSFGLFKKMILADTFAIAVTWGSENIARASSIDLILIMLSYTFQIYFDFSGYSDMAVGVSQMMNLTMPINFDSPYKAVSVRDFWNRWHVSLTKFLTKHIYIPLGGSRKGRIRTYINVLIVFTVSGIWHGANWTFILWGVIYGILSVLDRIVEPIWKKIFTPIKWLVTFLIVNVQWLLFNANNVQEWLYATTKMIFGRDFTLSYNLSLCFRSREMEILEDIFKLKMNLLFTTGTMWMILYLAVGLFICLVPQNNYKLLKKNSVIFMILAAVAFAWSFLFLGQESVFIYNDF